MATYKRQETNMNRADPGTLLDAAVGAAAEAGKILVEGFGTSFAAKTKSGVHDLVTEYDKTAEQCIIDKLKERFPGHSFLGEETGLSESAEGKEAIRWIIDPLDGTLNFCHAIPYFAVSIAAENSGGLLVGVVYNPVTAEMFTARKGGGTQLNGKPLNVSMTAELKDSVLAIGFPFDTTRDPDHCITRFARVAGTGAQLLRMGSTALNLAYVAAGRFAGFWETKFFPWDVAAGALIVAEAGGMVTNLDGSDLDMETDGIMTTNGHIHAELRSAVNG